MTNDKLTVVTALLLLATPACRGCNSNAARGPAADASRPLSATAVDAGTSAGATTALPMDAGNDMSSRGSRALLLRLGLEFVPLACFDARQRQLVDGAACFDLIAADPQVQVVESPGPRQRMRSRAIKPWTLTFEGVEPNRRGFRIDLPCPEPRKGSYKPPCVGPEGEAGEHALWPVSGFGRFKLFSRFDPKPADSVPARSSAEGVSDADGPSSATISDPGPQPVPNPALPGEVIDEIGSIARKIGFQKPPSLSIAQRIQADLDGDGVRETILCVALDASAELRAEDGGLSVDLPHTLYYLFVQRDGHFTRAPLPSDPLIEVEADAQILARMDLDGDGSDELWLQNSYFEGSTWMVVHWRDGAWEILGRATWGV